MLFQYLLLYNFNSLSREIKNRNNNQFYKSRKCYYRYNWVNKWRIDIYVLNNFSITKESTVYISLSLSIFFYRCVLCDQAHIYWNFTCAFNIRSYSLYALCLSHRTRFQLLFFSFSFSLCVCVELASTLFYVLKYSTYNPVLFQIDMLKFHVLFFTLHTHIHTSILAILFLQRRKQRNW